jgi:hypothetical protein
MIAHNPNSSSRKGFSESQLLNEQTQAIIVDGYEGYQNVCNTYQIKRLGCWAHARRKFVEAKKLQKKTGKADQALAFIQKLYALEKRINDKPNSWECCDCQLTASYLQFLLLVVLCASVPIVKSIWRNLRTQPD